MQFYFEVIGYGLVAPAVGAMLVLLVARFLAPPSARRSLLIIPLIAGFWTSWFLFDWAPLRPQSHWHWLPYLLLLAGMARWLAHTSRLWLNALIYLGPGVVFAWLLVPNWPDLQPARIWYWSGLALTVWIIPGGATRLMQDRPAAVPAIILFGTSLATAVILALSGSMKFAQLSGVLLPLVAAMSLANWRWPDEFQFSSLVAPIHSLLIGLLFVGCVNSFTEVPAWSYALIGAAPLGPLVSRIPRLEQRLGGWGSAVEIAAAAFLTGIGVGVGWATSGH